MPDCPLCGARGENLCINLTKNAWCTNCCGDSGGMLALYSKAQNVSKATAYSEICDAILNGGISQVREASQKERMQSEVVLSERASTQEIHQTYSTLLGMLQLIPAHRKHLQEKRGLTDEQIAAFGFKALRRRTCAALSQQNSFSRDAPSKESPGFIWTTAENGRSNFIKEHPGHSHSISECGWYDSWIADPT